MRKTSSLGKLKRNISRHLGQCGKNEEVTQSFSKTSQNTLNQQTLSKFFAFNTKREDTNVGRKRTAKSEVQEPLDDLPQKILKVESSATKRKEAVSTVTVQKLQGFSLENVDHVNGEKDLTLTPVSSRRVFESTQCSTSVDGRVQETDSSVMHVTDCSEIEDDNSDSDDSGKIHTKKSNASHMDSNISFKNIVRNDATSAHIDTSSKTKFTPLEKQFLELKNQYPDAILLVECGYKYRFFGEDAKLTCLSDSEQLAKSLEVSQSMVPRKKLQKGVASKELNISCFLYHNFPSASIPTHRLHVHVQRLVAKGYKVGVVKQTETAAVKAAGENKGSLFTRKLHALYTKSTLIGEDFKSQTSDSYKTENVQEKLCGSGYLACICESLVTTPKKCSTCIAVVAVQPTTGDVLYSNFEDTSTRTELENCLTYLNPVEMLLPKTVLDEKTENLIKNICDMSAEAGNILRLERMSDNTFEFTSALDKVSKFFKSQSEHITTQSSPCSEDIIQEILALPPLIICCLSALIIYLTEFNLESILKNLSNLSPLLSSSQHMTLNAVTLRNLEIFQNLADYSEHGSLFWALNCTYTKFGRKKLQFWVAKPLKDIRQIEERQDAITEFLLSESSVIPVIEKMLYKLPDLERGLCSALYLRCSCMEFVTLVKALTSVRNELQSVTDRVLMEIKTEKLRKTINEIPDLLDGVNMFCGNLDENSARKEDKTTLFLDISEFPSIVTRKQQIQDVKEKLKNLKTGICKKLHLLAFNYCTVSGQEYLIEVRNTNLSVVPSSWTKISATKQVSRFRSPEVETLYKQLQLLLEQLQQDCNEAWLTYLKKFGKHFYRYKKAVAHLAELDCYFSLAKFAKQQGYCRPVVNNNSSQMLNIVKGRNPVIEKLMGENNQYVANDTKLNCENRCMIITGPNMGGKSSYIRQVAIITILAQIGSYVPAASVEISTLDGIFTRMGAADDLYHRRSTFMVEMHETADILSHVTPKSLVVLDELGRGTSTHDGMAIAYATLRYLLNEVKCMTLFVTHYPPVAELQKIYCDNVSNNHMTFLIDEEDCNNSKDIGSLVFLYHLDEGMAEKSYGINVAELAGMSPDILIAAKQKSEELEQCLQQRRFVKNAINYLYSIDESDVFKKIERLKSLVSDNSVSKLNC